MQVCYYIFVIANLPSEPDLPSLINPAEDLNLSTARFFLGEILWNFNLKHMAGVHKCFNILIRWVQAGKSAGSKRYKAEGFFSFF